MENDRPGSSHWEIAICGKRSDLDAILTSAAGCESWERRGENISEINLVPHFSREELNRLHNYRIYRVRPLLIGLFVSKLIEENLTELKQATKERVMAELDKGRVSSTLYTDDLNDEFRNLCYKVMLDEGKVSAKDLLPAVPYPVLTTLLLGDVFDKGLNAVRASVVANTWSYQTQLPGNRDDNIIGPNHSDYDVNKAADTFIRIAKNYLEGLSKFGHIDMYDYLEEITGYSYPSIRVNTKIVGTDLVTAVGHSYMGLLNPVKFIDNLASHHPNLSFYLIYLEESSEISIMEVIKPVGEETLVITFEDRMKAANQTKDSKDVITTLYDYYKDTLAKGVIVEEDFTLSAKK